MAHSFILYECNKFSWKAKGKSPAVFCLLCNTEMNEFYIFSFQPFFYKGKMDYSHFYGTVNSVDPSEIDLCRKESGFIIE